MRGRPSPIVLTATLGLACTKPNPLFGDESTTTATTTAPVTTDPTTGAAADLSSGTDLPTTGEPGATSEAVTGTTSGSTSTGPGSTTTTQTAGTTGDASPPATCAEARELGMDESGVVMLAVPQQPGATLEVWCEQQLAGGGWLLVARSTDDDVRPGFGWGIVAGDLLDDDRPYSLNLLAYKFPATELLIGSYSEGKQLSGYAYQLSAPDDFPLPYDMAAGMTSAPQRVLGDCDPAGGPSMLRWIGYTKLGDRYRLRDQPESDADDMYGLFASGFLLGVDNCSDGGKLDSTQGMIFVR